MTWPQNLNGVVAVILLKDLPVAPYGVHLLTLGAPLPSEGHYGQMARTTCTATWIDSGISLALG